MKRISVALLVLSAGLWLGCGRSTTVTGPEGEEVTVTQDGGGEGITATIQHDDGSTVRVATNAQGVKLPDDFPADVPIYPGATVTTCLSTDDTLEIVTQTTDSLQQAKAFYLDKLKELGWETAERAEATGAVPLVILSASKDERELPIMITRADDTHTMITLSVGKLKQ